MQNLKLLVLVGLVMTLGSCNSHDTTIPHSDKRPNLFVFCNNTDVQCFDFGYLTPYFENIFGEETITFGYFYVDSEPIRDIVNSLEITSLPTYMIFDTQGQEIFRASGTVELDVLEAELRTLLQEE